MIAVGSDHGGFDLKNEIKSRLEKAGYEVKDFGCYDTNSVDYPDIAKALCSEVSKGNYECGMLFCGTGIGMSIAANKVDGIRCALLSDVFSAKMSKMHNNANVIAIGARVTGVELAWEMTNAYLSAEFLGGRHENRVNKIMALEK